jgi:hypothetical protein
MSKAACFIQDRWIGQYRLYSRRDFSRFRVLADGSPDTRGYDAFRVVRLIAALRNAD